MPSKLEELKDFVAKNYHEAKTPEEVEKQVKLNNLIAEACKESNDLVDANTRLSTAYREALNSIPATKEPHGQEDKRGIIPSFDEALKNAANGKDIYGQANNK